uniref:Acetylcholinesterase n=1 Tax=Parastrongyloides trichosuri TaxID=131310 RepID=A0A0N4Z1L6_PARTI
AIGDFLFNCDTAKFARESNRGKKNKVYFFEFKKNSTVNPWPQWMNPMHGYELEYIFGMPYRNSSLYDNTLLSNEKKYADKIMEFYGNFAKLGYPNSNWHPYKKANTTTFNSTNCALLDANLTKDNHELRYRNVITDKCKLLNEIAEKHFPRCVDCFSFLDYIYSWVSSVWYWGNPENIWNEISKNETFISFTNRTINFGTSFF